MATLIPAINSEDISQHGERNVVIALLDQLPNDAHVYHSFETLQTVERAGDRKGKRLVEGEIDAIVVWPGNGVLVLEIKSGMISYNAHDHTWSSTDYHGVKHSIKNPFEQARQYHHQITDIVCGALKCTTERLPCPIGYGVVFTDCTVSGALPHDADPSLICCCEKVASIGQYVKDLLLQWRTDRLAVRDTAGANTSFDMGKIKRALSPQFNVIPVLSARVAAEEQQFIKLTENQIRYLDFAAQMPKARVEGVAGSGKTLLAVEQAQRYAAQGLSTLLLCYNKGLSAWLRTVLDPSLTDLIKVYHFHDWCRVACEQHHIEFDPASSESIDTFWKDTAAELLLQCADVTNQRFDAIIVDEGQDFREDWWLAVEEHLADDGKFFVFYDQAQDIFNANGLKAIEPLQILPLPENCRNTKAIAEHCASILGCEIKTGAMTPQGVDVTTTHIEDETKRLVEIQKNIGDWVKTQNLHPSQIAILSPYQKKKTCLHGMDQIAKVNITESIDDWHDNKGILFSTIRAF